MKNYTITVNGNVYDVTVEEKGSTGAAPVAAAHLHQRQHLRLLQAPEASRSKQAQPERYSSWRQLRVHRLRLAIPY